MIRIIFVLLTTLLLAGCGRPVVRPSIQLPEIGTVYDSNGRVSDYEIDKSKPRVVTIIRWLENIDGVYGHTPANKINRIIAENPDYEFIFYFGGIDRGDSLEVFSKLEKYNIDYPVMMDWDDEFYLLNKKKLGDIAAYSMICDTRNKIFDGATIGTTMSFFDSTFARAKKAIARHGK